MKSLNYHLKEARRKTRGAEWALRQAASQPMTPERKAGLAVRAEELVLCAIEVKRLTQALLVTTPDGGVDSANNET